MFPTQELGTVLEIVAAIKKVQDRVLSYGPIVKCGSFQKILPHKYKDFAIVESDWQSVLKLLDGMPLQALPQMAKSSKALLLVPILQQDFTIL